MPFYVIWDNSIEIAIKIGNSESKEIDHENLLGIAFDKKLNFREYIDDLCRKIHALARLSNYIDPVKSEIVVNSFISSQFNCCSLV